MTRHAPRILFALVIMALFVGHASHYFRIALIDQLETLTYDTRLRLTMPRDIDERVVIVDVDEKSLKAEGRWPWNRVKLKTLVDRLFEDYNVSVIGFDMLFAEEDESEDVQLLIDLASKRGETDFVESISEFAAEIDRDKIFSDALVNRPVVLGFVFQDADRTIGNTGVLPQPTLSKGEFRREWSYPARGRTYSGNIAQLQEHAADAGFFSNAAIDEDGLWRRVSMLMEYDGSLYPSLSLSLASLYLHQPVEPGLVGDSGLLGGYPRMEWLDIGGRRIPVDAQVSTLIPYRGEQGSFPYVSAVDVLRGEVEDANVFKDSIVLIGTTALGLGDHRPSPIGKLFPGVEIHANIISGILDNSLKQSPAYTRGVDVAILIISALLMLLVFSRVGATRGTFFTLGLMAVVLIINLLCWTAGNLVLPLASALAQIVLLYLVYMSYGYFVESRARRELGGLFGQYVPPELVEEMSFDPAHYTLEGERREMTVMFSDVRGFTHIAETLDPRELSQMLNEFLTWFTRVIHTNRGTIDKYMGDGVMAFWGAPIEDPEHARRALDASLQLIRELPELRESFAARGWPQIRIGVGLNTGVMNVGNMGSDFRMAYTVVGDAVNIGARLEDATKTYGVDILVGEETRTAIEDFAFREVDRVQLRGRDRAVSVFEPLAPADNIDDATRDELKIYRQGLSYYRNRNWDLAELQFINLQHTHPNTPLYATYIDRIRQFRQTPPAENWDGTFNYEP